MSSPQPNLRRKETRQSPFKVPDDKNIFLQSKKEKENRKKEMRKYLALPLDEKMTHTARMEAKMRKELAQELKEEEEDEEKAKNLQQTKSKATRPKHTETPDLKMATIEEDNVKKETPYDFITMERHKHVLEYSLRTMKREIKKMDEMMSKDDKKVKEAESLIAADNYVFAEFLKENERKILEARTISEEAAKTKQEKNAEIKRLIAEIGLKKSEVAKNMEILKDYKRYKNLLFMLSPPEWKEAQRIKAVNAEVQSDSDSDESAGVESKVSNSVRELPPIKELQLSSAQSDTLITDSDLDSDSSEYEDEPELYFSDPRQLLDLLKELTEQDLSLIQNTARVNEKVKEHQKTIDTTREKFEQEEEQLRLQIKEMMERIAKETTRAADLKQKVLLSDFTKLDKEEQEIMMEAVGGKVAGVFHSCVDDRITNLRTIEMLAKIENRVCLLMETLENIPAETLAVVRMIKDKERRTRQREEQLVQQKVKQEERMKRYLERSLADIKKRSGRKLMPRHLPITQKIKVKDVEDTLEKDELYDYLFSYSV
ncbi:hypothetical protein LDENG_00237760 [Lucifuga dentata]|nr:hypothetical protein LDENG_00237760 [Lucifuga dentata]